VRDGQLADFGGSKIDGSRPFVGAKESAFWMCIKGVAGMTAVLPANHGMEPPPLLLEELDDELELFDD
jgi:hypothetical protein